MSINSEQHKRSRIESICSCGNLIRPGLSGQAARSKISPDMDKRIQTQLRAGKGILPDAHANKRDKISSQAAIVSPRLTLANVRSRRGKLHAITASLF
jgi:hypothetical protein